MATRLSDAQIHALQQNDVEQRYQFFLKHVLAQQVIWILTDEHGCVMLNTDDEDCVPVWPDQAFADAWATGDWAGCHAEAIPLSVWFERWTAGLQDDDLALAIFPLPDEDGLILTPADLEDELRYLQQQN